MAESIFLVDVSCKTCGRSRGLAPSLKGISRRIYCDMMCFGDYSAVDEEGRDALIEAAMRYTDGALQKDIAELFGTTRQRVSQILAARNISHEEAA
jgi:hypothetical protein